MNKKITISQICLIGMAVCMNVLGGQLALLFRLPIYLDSIGTILIGAWLGPVFGILPNLLSGLIMGMTTDVYSLYFAPVGMLTGLMAGLAAGNLGKGQKIKKIQLFSKALFITLPGTLASSLICAVLFGGITSSGSTILVQLLSKTPLSMTASIFIVQILTDYLDRVISLLLVAMILETLPSQIKNQCRQEKTQI